MHDTAQTSGRHFFEAYLPGNRAKVLDVGSMDVNGTLRAHAKPGWTYIGLDLEPGPGVEVVITPNGTFPFRDKSFNAVLSTSCFEHDDMFWVTFLEMCRVVKPGGFIYISAPSNGTYHRFPQDNWRFYPDSGEALARWARRSGFDVHLCESGTLRRETDFWNDFVAVFRLGPAKLPEVPMLARIPTAMNVRTGDSDDVERFSLESEDMLLLNAARGELAAANDRLAPLNEIATYAPLPSARLQVIAEAFPATGGDDALQAGAMARALEMHSLTIADLRRRLADEQALRDERDNLTRMQAEWLRNEVNLRSHVAHVEAQLLTAQADTKLREQELEALRADLDEARHREDNLRAHAVRIEDELKQAHLDGQDRARANEQLSGELRAVGHQMQQILREKAEWLNERKSHEARVQAMEAAIEHHRGEAEAQINERARLASEIERVLAESAAARQAAEEERREQLLAQQRVQQLEETYAALTATHEQLLQAHKVLGEEITEVRAQMARVAAELEVARADLMTVREAASHLQSERDDLRARLESENLVTRQLRDEKRDLEGAMAEQAARVEAIEASTSWKITSPIRRVVGIVKRS